MKEAKIGNCFSGTFCMNMDVGRCSVWMAVGNVRALSRQCVLIINITINKRLDATSIICPVYRLNTGSFTVLAYTHLNIAAIYV